MSTTTQTAPEIVNFGPSRAVGISYIAGNGNMDFHGVWDRLMKRMGEIPAPGKRWFGLCRCIPGVTDGTWEYVAAIETTDSSRTPEGMIHVDIPAGEYASITVENLANVGAAWTNVQKGAAAVPGYESYCGPKGCDCANHPSFEYYPPDFPQTNRLYLYIPLKRV